MCFLLTSSICPHFLRKSTKNAKFHMRDPHIYRVLLLIGYIIFLLGLNTLKHPKKLTIIEALLTRSCQTMHVVVRRKSGYRFLNRIDKELNWPTYFCLCCTVSESVGISLQTTTWGQQIRLSVFFFFFFFSFFGFLFCSFWATHLALRHEVGKKSPEWGPGSRNLNLELQGHPAHRKSKHD